MLYLSQRSDEADAAGASRARPIPVGDETALALENALLATLDAARLEVLSTALAEDGQLAEWALRRAARRLGRAEVSVDEAAAWLANRLALELDAAFQDNGIADQSRGSAKLDASANREIAQRLPMLVAKFASYERRLADFDARLEREKIESLKELAYGASHEINNPLANIAARAQTLRAEEANPERQRKLAAIHRQAMRAHEMIADLMLFARPPKLEIAPCDLRQIAARVVGELSDLAAEREIALQLLPGESASAETVELPADATQIAVAIHALVINALEAVGAGGRVSVAVGRCRPLAPADDAPTDVGRSPGFAEIKVCDDGPGISQEARRHLFDPFFSGREAGRGLGFGLSKCWRIVTDHGGQVVIDQPSGGHGAEVTILLPILSE